MKEKSSQAPVYMTFVLVWAGLVALTLITVAFARLGLGGVLSFAIAGLKAFLVGAFFMRLKYETNFFRLIVLVSVFTLGAVSWLVYYDVAYR